MKVFINRQESINLICKELDKGFEKASIRATVGRKWPISDRTFQRHWLEAKKQHSERQELIKTELIKDRLELEKEHLRESIKTKNERIMILQSQINDIVSEIEQNTCQDVDAKGRAFTRALLPNERTAMRKAIRDLQSEISKIEGDYAATKQDVNMTGSINPENWLKLQSDNGGK